MISQGFSGSEVKFSIAIGTNDADALEKGGEPGAGRRRFSVTCHAKFWFTTAMFPS